MTNKTNNERNDTMTMENKTHKRLTYLAQMIKNYAHCWGENPSNRLYGWVTEYNDIRRELFEEGRFSEWDTFCGSTFPVSDPEHDAADLLA